MDKESAKVMRHLPLALSIDGLLALLIGAPIWSVVHTGALDGLGWWPWVAAVMVGLVIWYAICEDDELVALVAEAPRVMLYAVVLLVTAPWWVPQVNDLSMPFDCAQGEGDPNE